MVWFFVIITVPLVAAAAFYWRWRRMIDAEVAEGAAIEWAHLQKHEPEFLTGVSEEKFREIYALVHTPRFPGYALAMVTTFFVSLPVTFAVLALVMWGAQAVGAVPEPVDVANRLFLEDGKLLFFRSTPPEAALYYIRDVSGFYYFFGVLAAWLGIVAFFMRRFHRRRPGYLRDEIIRIRE
jgi:hypothetical protein